MVQMQELNMQIADLTTESKELALANNRTPVLLQRICRYAGIGIAGKLSWVRFKLKYKQEQLARLALHPDEQMNNDDSHFGMVPAAKRITVAETLQQKMERMVNENPPELAPHIRRVYQVLIEANAQ